MRLVLVAPVLTLVACTLENPVFLVESASEAPPASSTTDPATTGATAASATDASVTTPTTSATGMTGMTGDTGDTDETTTGATPSTTSPVGTSEGSTDAGATDTGDGGGDTNLDECLLLKAPSPADPQVQVIATQQDYVGCPDITLWQGRLKVSDGALTLTSLAGCKDPNDPPKYRLGKDFNMLTPEGTVFPCVLVRLLFNKNGCKIASMEIDEVGTGKLLFAAAFSGPNNIGVKTKLIPGGCSCPGEAGCCMGFDPGNYALYIDGSDPVGPGELGEVSHEGHPMWLHNIQSWIDEPCSAAAFDWYIEPRM